MRNALLSLAIVSLAGGSSLSLARPATEHSAGAVAVPAKLEAPRWPELRYSRDPALQDALVGKLKDLSLSRYASQGKLAVALVDVTVPENPRVAAVNAHRAMYAASLPKIAILLGAFQKAADGLLTLDEPTLEKLTAMIRVSSNSAATEMLEKVGYEYLEDVLVRRYKLYDPSMNGGLWVGKPYAKSRTWKRDPLHNLSHAATVFECARFYYLLETGRLVSPKYSRMMKEILSEPAIHHKFVAGLEAHRPGSEIFRKSGTWRDWHADSAIVERNGRTYIAVALAQSPSGGEWLSRLIVALDDLVFDPANIARDRTPLTTVASLEKRSMVRETYLTPP